MLFCIRSDASAESRLLRLRHVGEFTTSIIAVDAVQRRLHAAFRHIYFRCSSDDFRAHVHGSSAGAALISEVNIRGLDEFPFRLRIEEQKHIVAKLDALREETQRLESIYQRKLAALEALKKSLLHQAFTGNL